MTCIERGVRMLLAVILAGSCAFHGVSASDSGALNPRYFELVSLHQKADATHLIAVEGSDGNAWYRTPGAILDLRDMATDRAWPDKSPVDDTYYVRLMVRHESQQCQRVRSNGHGTTRDPMSHASNVMSATTRPPSLRCA